MSDSLTRYQENPPETREEALTRQFYDWELRGRGWRVFSYPVELEPPFRPFYLFDTRSSRAADDGRKPTLFSNLIENLSRKVAAKNQSGSQSLIFQERLAEMDEPSVCDYYDEEFTEFRLVLPKDFRVTKAISEQLLLSLSYCSSPIGFEVIGTSKEIIVQLASTERDSAQLRQQLEAHLPGAGVQENEGVCLIDAWQKSGDYSLVADFGLSREFMLPLSNVSSFDADPLIAVIGALADLRNEEAGVFQVLFQKAKFDWAEEIIGSVRFFDGTPFFVNAPEMIPLAKQKVSRPLFAACIRVAAKSFGKDRAWQIVRSLGAGLSQLASPAGNELIPLTNDDYHDSYHEQALLHRQSFRCGMILNCEELASLVHPPSPAVQSEKLVRESERTKAVASLALGHTLVLGENVHHGKSQKVTLSNKQRTKHIHLVGSSGSGKSTLMLNLIKQDLENNQGLCVIDPHGDLIDEVIANVPDHRINDVILFDPSDAEYPIGFNILGANSELEKTLLSSDLIATFRRMSTSWGDVMDSVLANAVLAFLESSRGGTLFELKRFLVEKDFRSKFLESVADEAVRYFWQNEFPLITGKPQSSILIRLDAFLRQKLIRNVVCQEQNKINFREVMDERKVLLIKLSEGAIGEENSYLLGTLIMAKLYQTALSRQDTRDRPFFSCYLDEFHHFIAPSMENVLSGVRKYNLGLVLAHQEFRQLQSRSQEVAASVLSNCYTRICFRLGDTDAERFASGFSFFDAKALQNLSVGEAVGRIERSEYDFNLKTDLLPEVVKEAAEQRRREIIRRSRERYGIPKSEVESNLFAVQVKPIIADVPAGEESKAVLPKTKDRKPKFESRLPETVSEETNEHRYLQQVTKRVSENYGFVATLEKSVFGGIGKVDVALENEHRKIACEIAVTNTVDYELQNIQKCLAAGFNSVVVISADAKHLGNIRKKAEVAISADRLAKVHFLEPEIFHLFLDGLREQSDIPATDKTKIKGYKVSARFKQSSEAENHARKQTVFDILSNFTKRKGKNSD